MAIIGKVVALTGTAYLITGNGVKRELQLGDTVQASDTIQTLQGAEVELELASGRPMHIGSEQLVAFTDELTNILGSDSLDGAVNLATIETVIKAIESGKDISEVLEETAAGNNGLMNVHGFDFVDLLRINDVLNQFGFNYDFNFNANIQEQPIIKDFLNDDTNNLGEIGAIKGNGNGAGGSSNVAPVATAATFTGNEDASSIALPLTGTDADGTISAIRVTALPTAAQGALVYDNDGNPATPPVAVPVNSALTPAQAASIQFIPTANFNGTVNIPFTVTDNSGATSPAANAIINVNSVNDAPVNTVPLSTQAATVNTALSITGISVNDVDGNLATSKISVLNGNLTVSLAGGATISSGANGTGTLTLSGTQAQINAALATVSYKGTQDFNGSDTLTVLSTDNAGTPLSDSDTVAISVLDTTAPTGLTATLTHDATNDTGTSNTDNLTSNASPAIIGTGTPGDTITLYAPDGTTVLGTVVVPPSGTWSIDPAGNYLVEGSNNLIVKETDPAGNVSAPVTVPVTLDTTAPAAPTGVLPQNSTDDTGVSNTDNLTANNNPTLTGTAEPNSTVTVVVGGTTYNNIPVNGAGTWSLLLTTPLADGTYTPSITTTDAAGNISPVASGETFTVDATSPTFAAQNFNYAENSAPGSVVANLIATDSSAVQSYSFGGSAMSPDGFFQINSAGVITMTAAGAASAANNFELGSPAHTYAVTVVDAAGNSTIANVTLNETNVNEAPVANADTAAVTEDLTLTVSDTDGVIRGTIGGSVADTDVDNAINTLTISGAVAGAGAVTQGAGINISLVGTYGHLTISTNGGYTYVADKANSLAAGITATDTFTYTIKDPGGLVSNTTTLTITVTGTNDVPTLNAGTGTVKEDGTLTATGLLTINDPDAGQNTFQPQSNAATPHGTFSVDNLGNWTYNLNNSLPSVQALGATEQLTDTITVLAFDGTPTTVTITINGTNDVPTANADLASTPFNTPLNNINILANDTDPDTNDTLTVTSATLATPSQGTVSINNDGTLNFTPAAATAGAVVINYSISDGHGGTSSSTLTVNVGTNTPPDSADIAKTILEDNTYTFAKVDFAFTDADVPAQTINAVRIDTLPANGTLTLNGSLVSTSNVIPIAEIVAGHLIFTPAPDANGANYGNFTFSVQDSFGGFDTTPNTFTINVTAVSDIVADSITTSSTAPITFNPLTGTNGASADNFESPAAATTVIGTPLHGTAILNGNGTITYTPTAGYVGPDSFTYTVTSGGGTETATISVGVTNDAPVNTVPSAQSVNEDTALSITGISVNDVDAVNHLPSVKIKPKSVHQGVEAFHYYLRIAEVNGDRSKLRLQVGSSLVRNEENLIGFKVRVLFEALISPALPAASARQLVHRNEVDRSYDLVV